ncbi:flagellar hook-basal body complex protein [Polynucleobacter sp. AP-Jannik-300A-C4]|uniref:flagellar hook-basal body complex protein n=1 Tax=Polynucleobacter sp. AP-Jannik-300A-C4 TaxID=2576928 RepID=UPI001BFE45BB|nr:flagellar hook-basal body complex protein [Polynucleobacter sp. AP-Jannik-300A-C4]QWE23079.1 flagellar hook-basal body complex protein [Polynucleobacter sp. AP-Jannik-300A-C4]
MGYGIGLSGLKSASEAIDVTSNNISNAQTVGYKSGEYVFSDQFFRAQDPQSVDRAGMGAYRMAIRRTGSYGTVVNSQNPLDMAITGPGMFMMAKTVDGTVPTENPTKFQYSRNGQFAVDNQNRIVNENGMYLVGYPADSSGTIISSAKSVLILDRTPLAQQPTRNSSLELNLDNRVDPKTGSIFSPTDPNSYSQATSQTVYDDKGFAHTLATYYKKVSSQLMTVTAADVGTAASSSFTFSPTSTINNYEDTAFNALSDVDPFNRPAGEQFNRIATTAVALGTGSATLETIYESTLTAQSGQENTVGTVYNLRLRDGTNVTLTQTVAGTSSVKAQYTVNVDRFEVFATIDGNPVTPDASVTQPTKPNIVITNGVDSTTTESAAVTFRALAAGETLTIGGLTLTATAAISASAVAAGFASKTSGATAGNSVTGGTWSGTLTGWDTSAVASGVVTFTSVTATADVSNLTCTLTPDVLVGGATDRTILIEGEEREEQLSLGVMGFIAGKNIDSLSRDSFGTPQFATRFNIDASRGEGSVYGQTLNGGSIQLTIEGNGTTAYSSAAQTYTNTQDGSATSQLASYNIDSSGKLVAQYDNGSSVVKGQLILAYFNNLEGLIPNGNNTYEASSASGEPLLSFPGDGTLGAIRSKAVEQSNVDLTEELVKLMVLQRQYSAVSQATKVMAATLIDDAINIGR